jgi:hypothetical protein
LHLATDMRLEWTDPEGPALSLAVERDECESAWMAARVVHGEYGLPSTNIWPEIIAGELKRHSAAHSSRTRAGRLLEGQNARFHRARA